MFSDIDVLCKLGHIKYNIMKTDPLRFFVRSFMAGAYLGVAAILSYTLGALLNDHTVVGKIAVAGTFGIGCNCLFRCRTFYWKLFCEHYASFKRRIKVSSDSSNVDCLLYWEYGRNCFGLFLIYQKWSTGSNHDSLFTRGYGI